MSSGVGNSVSAAASGTCPAANTVPPITFSGPLLQEWTLTGLVILPTRGAAVGSQAPVKQRAILAGL
jgi:hypothetical protein